MRFHILGLGPVGSLLAHHLRRCIPAPHSIVLIHKNLRQAKEAARKGGIIRVENNGIISSSSGFISEIFEGISLPSASTNAHDSTLPRTNEQDMNPIDSLFVTTKANQTLPAVRRLAPRITPNSTIVLMQNGMGMYEDLIQNIFLNPSQRPHFVFATNTHGVYSKGIFDIVHAGIGAVEFGIIPENDGRDFEAGLHDENIDKLERRPRLTDITSTSQDPQYARYKSLRDTVSALLLTDSLHMTWLAFSDVRLAMRRKLVVNSVINPLTALMGCRNGDIFIDESAQRINHKVCREAAAAFAAQISVETEEWLRRLESEGIDVSTVDIPRIPRGLTAASLEDEVLRVSKLTKGNISSMLSDIRVGRPTEIDYLNGYLARIGRTYRVGMPTTSLLRDLVKLRSSVPLDQIL